VPEKYTTAILKFFIIISFLHIKYDGISLSMLFATGCK